jgi:hypothetical protein
MDGTFVILPHGHNRLRDFLHYLNFVHQNIKFTLKSERDYYLPFLDIDIYKRPDEFQGISVP